MVCLFTSGSFHLGRHRLYIFLSPTRVSHALPMAHAVSWQSTYAALGALAAADRNDAWLLLCASPLMRRYDARARKKSVETSLPPVLFAVGLKRVRSADYSSTSTCIRAIWGHRCWVRTLRRLLVEPLRVRDVQVFHEKDAPWEQRGPQLVQIGHDHPVRVPRVVDDDVKAAA